MSLRHTKRVAVQRGNRIVTPPATEPVTLDELKEFLRIDGTGDDALLTSLIVQSRQFIEDMSGLALITQTWLVALDGWPLAPTPHWDGVRHGAVSELDAGLRFYELPRYPLASVSGIDVYASDGTATAVDVAATFDVDTYRMPGRLAIKSGATWPVVGRPTNGVEITYIAGYGDASDVPEPLKVAVKQLAAYMYEHAGQCAISSAYGKSGAKDSVSVYAVMDL